MPLPSRSLMLLALILLLLFFNIGARAENVVSTNQHSLGNGTKGEKFEFVNTQGNASDEDLTKDTLMEVERPYSCRAIFPESSSPMFPNLHIGTKTKSLIAYHNYDPTTTFHILLASGNIKLDQNDMVIQNFSAVRHARIVRPGETVTLDYQFTPSNRLEPSSYRLFIGVNCINTTNNQTFLVTAFEGEVIIGDTLSTDPRTILTYFTLITVMLIMVYGISVRLGITKKIVVQWQNRKRNARLNTHTETGTVDNSYDPEYISAEHLRYRDAMIKRHESHSSTRKKK